MTLRLHAFLPRSRANGPGWRSVVWVQGCSLGCAGCFNPQTHDPEESGEAGTMAGTLFRSVRANELSMLSRKRQSIRPPFSRTFRKTVPAAGPFGKRSLPQDLSEKGPCRRTFRKTVSTTRC